MAEIQLGSNFDFLRHVITLRSVGRVAVIIGRGIVVGIGTASQGPAMEMYGLTKNSQIETTFGTGLLPDGLATALDQGADCAFGVRVLGQGYAAASLDLFDSQVSPVKMGAFTAAGPGVAGNIPTFEWQLGDIYGSVQEVFDGTGQTTPYMLQFDDIVHPSTYNRITVAGATKAIVYTGNPGATEVKIDPVTGGVTFGTWPTRADQISIRYHHTSRKLIIRNGSDQPIGIPNIVDLVQLNAKLKNSNIATFTAVYGATHLPAVAAATNMIGGDDGDDICYDDWNAAFNTVYDWADVNKDIVASSIFTTANSATEGQMDIVGLMDGFLWRMADKKRPLQGFITLDSTMSTQDMKDFKTGYTNLWMTLITNGLTATERNLAPGRAGQEAALPLGTSPATSSNSIKGVDGLLWQWNEVDREDLTYAGLEVMVKDTGVHPYVGVSTDLDDNFRRTVDIRTYADIIIFMDKIVMTFLNERRTLTNLSRLQTSFHLFLDMLLKASVLDDFTVAVGPDYWDHNAVDIETWIQCVGHMERFYHVMNVGYWSDKVAV